MNASQIPLVNIADPFPTKGSSGLRAGGSGSQGSGGSFDAVYSDERNSQSRERLNNTINNNNLESKEASDKNKKNETGALSEPEERGNVAHREATPENDKTAIEQAQKQRSDSSEDHIENDEQSQNEALVSGIATTVAASDDKILRGEHLPSGGKNLPVLNAASMKSTQLPSSVVDTDAQEFVEPSEKGLDQTLASIGTHSKTTRSIDWNDRNDLFSQQRLIRLTPDSSDYFQIEDAMDTISSKGSAESILDSLALLAPSASKESGSTPGTNNLLASAAIAVANSDSPTTPVQSLSGASAESVDASLNVRGNSTDWSHAIGDKIRWMRNASVSTAELHLNPAELGSIEIKIVTEDHQARVSFITSSTVAQEMIEESLSKLKELLADHGIALDQSDISQRGNQNEFAEEDSRSPASEREPSIENQFEHEAALSLISPVASRIGQVDHYV